MESYFKVKEMAGKIVPAISSSNALAASLQVAEAIKLLEQKHAAFRGIVYQRTNESVRMNSYGRANDKPNPDCQVCADDSQTIVLCTVKDFSSFTLGDLKQKVLFGNEVLALSDQTLMIELNSKIIYEFDKTMVEENDPDDEDEIALNKKRLLKTLSQLQLTEKSVMQVQATKTGGEECVIILQVNEDKNSEQEFKCEVIKLGKPKPIKEVVKPKEIKKTGDVEISSDDCLVNDGQGEFFLPQKRAAAEGGE